MFIWGDSEGKGWLQGKCQDTLDKEKGLSLEGMGGPKGSNGVASTALRQGL